MVSTVVFAGGGTGGHLYPALAVAEAVTARAPDTEFVYLCSTRAVDRTVLSAAGVEPTPIPAMPISARPTAMLRFLMSWPKATRAAADAIRAAGEATVLVATGGFVAAPAARAAKRMRVPVLLVNLDAVPGRANRWIANWADEAFTAARGGPGAFVGPVVRRALREGPPQAACRRAFGLDADKPTLLVTGGSLGARTINDTMIELARSGGLPAGWQVLHQTGSDDNGAIVAAYRYAGVPAEVRTFVDDMPGAWRSADLAITRGGAGAVAELSVVGVPAIVLPYPYHKDEHQRLNAAELAEAGAVVICDDTRDGARNARTLRGVLGSIAAGGRLAAMREAIATFSARDGAAAVAEAILGRLDGR